VGSRQQQQQQQQQEALKCHEVPIQPMAVLADGVDTAMIANSSSGGGGGGSSSSSSSSRTLVLLTARAAAAAQAGTDRLDCPQPYQNVGILAVCEEQQQDCRTHPTAWRMH
jgi:hypothetical protein